jgi:hypothetical protein
MTDNKPLIQNNKTSKIIAAVCVLVIVAVGLFLLLKDDKTTPATQVSYGDASLSLSPATQAVTKGQQIDVSVWANSGSKGINTVEADINYPADYFDFVSVDDTNSSLPYAVEGDAKDGVITIVRGTTSSVKGNSLVAVVKLQAKDQAGVAKLSFSKDSKVFTSNNNKNILSKTGTGTYTIK